MAKPKKNDLVHVRVIKHLPQGLSIVLESGQHGIIRTREISWKNEEIKNWRLDFPVGWEGLAIPIPVRKGEIREYSLRLVENDPWDDFFDGFDKSEIFEGVVTSVYEYGVFLEIEPGISGLLHKSQLPQKLQSSVLELFWYGDKVFVSIHEVDNALRQIGLRLAPSERASEESRLLVGQNQLNSMSDANWGMEQILQMRIPHRHILLVEDEISQARAVSGWLREMGQSVEVVHNAEDAIAYLSQTHPDIALVDIGLPVMSGTELTRFILQNHPQVQVVNATDWARANDVSSTLDELQAQGGKLLYKPLLPEDLASYLLYEQDQRGISQKHADDKSFIPKLPTHDPGKVIHALLSACKKRLNVEQVFLFSLDMAHRRIHIVERAGDGMLNKHALTQLIYSPVRDVAEDRKAIIFGEIGDKDRKRFQYLLEFLPSTVACIGIPVPAQTTIKYALFATAPRPREFTEEDEVYVDGLALAIGAALDQNDLRERSAMLQQSALIGNLASGMIHEINNLVTPLQYESDSLRRELERSEKNPEHISFSKIKRQVTNIEQDIRQIINTVNMFGKIAKKPKVEVIRVDEIIKDTLTLLRELSKRANVDLQFNPPENLVVVRNQAVVLEQIVLNVALNAIQQIGEHRTDGKGRIQIDMEVIKGTQESATCRILIIDNGPGIHATLWDKVFEMGFSTRQDGSGIGLFVSRNLMEEIDGKVYIANSHILHGSVFALEFPIQL